MCAGLEAAPRKDAFAATRVLNRTKRHVGWHVLDKSAVTLTRWLVATASQSAWRTPA